MSALPEIDALVSRVGLSPAMEAVRSWLVLEDRRAGIPPPAWREPIPLARTLSFGAAGSSPQPPAPGTEDEPRVSDCPLHGPMQSGGLCHTANSSGYSTFSPPCNGCSHGQNDRAAGLWMSGFGSQRNVFYSDGTGPMQPLYPAGGAGGGGGLAPTPSGYDSPPVSESYRTFSRLQTIMLDCLQEAEAEPTLWRIDNLINAMETFRAAGGGDGDNYRYCQERLSDLQNDNRLAAAVPARRTVLNPEDEE